MPSANPFPFKKGVCAFAHNAVVNVIRHSPTFQFELPRLSNETWASICNDDDERERLEFIGDSLLGSALSKELYSLRSQASPDIYTKARSVLTANSTFAHLMDRLGFKDMMRSIKPAGDALETIVAAYYYQSGEDALRRWIKLNFTPLIEVVIEAQENYLRDGPTCIKKTKNRNNVNNIRRALLKKAKSHQTITKKQARPFRLQSTRTAARRPVFIDLTVDSDWEDLQGCQDIHYSRSTTRSDHNREKTLMVSTLPSYSDLQGPLNKTVNPLAQPPTFSSGRFGDPIIID